MGVNGYRRLPLRVTFEESELEGLVVRARRLTVAEVRDLVEPPGGSRAERERHVCEILAGAIREWNYEDDDGTPVEPTAENLDTRVDRVVIDALVDELLKASTRASPPLPQPSDDGSLSAEEFKLMEALSNDPVSSPGPS